MKQDVWEGCYDMQWGDTLVPDAFSHPAKVAPGLAARIIKHALQEGWIHFGDTLLDPFSGIAGFAYHAMFYGINYVGIELEKKFVDLAWDNINKWNHDLRGLPTHGTARIVQGDSRNLKAVLELADILIASPPYVDSIKGEHEEKETAEESRAKRRTKGGSLGQSQRHGGYGTLSGQLGSMPEGTPPKADMVVGSPPYAESEIPPQSSACGDKRGRNQIIKIEERHYGSTPGQLASLPEGKFDAVISSPNFPLDQPCPSQTRAKKDYHSFTRGDGTKRDHEMRTKANLASLPEGKFDAVIGSPPYEGVDLKFGRPGNVVHKMIDEYESGNPRKGQRMGQNNSALMQSTQYSGLGQMQGDTFWSASRTILEQCFDVLKPRGHAIWVCKDYVKGGKRVPFSERWVTLCESVGFKLVHWHRASLVTHHGTQKTIHNGDEEITTERKSFFRRLAESKGSPRIDAEDILCMVKE